MYLNTAVTTKETAYICIFELSNIKDISYEDVIKTKQKIFFEKYETNLTIV